MSDVQVGRTGSGAGGRGRGRSGGFEAVVRKAKGPWQERQRAATARDAKRSLAKALGLPVRWADALPVGRSQVSGVPGGWAEVKVEASR